LAKRESKQKIRFDHDKVVIVETNVDDVTGEVIGATLAKLLAEGAFDATSTSFVGKSGRPGNTIKVVCDPKDVQKFAEILVTETGTLGVKTAEYTRLIVPRKNISMPVKIGRFEGRVNVKVARIGTGYRYKPELADALRISEKENLPLPEVLEMISSQVSKKLDSR
jgi:pyridinium-3,5-bisthiocarboxylic acid mononucleotide nickel chelatase